MEDDDDFGDLYTDVLRPISDPPPLPQPPPPISSSSLNPSPPPRPLDFNLEEEEEEEEGDDEDFFPGGPDPKFFSLRPQTLASDPLKDSVKPIDLRQSSRGRDDADGEFRFEEEEEHNNQKEEIGTSRVSAEEVVVATTTTATPAVPNVVDMVPESLKPKFVSSGIGDKSRRLFMEKEEVEVEEDNLEINLDAEPTIPGLSVAGPFFPGVFDEEEGAEEEEDEEGSKKEEDSSGGGGGGGDDWDSDSDDDIQIVLNDNSARPGVDRMEGGGGGGEDEDGQDLVIVADVDHQPTEQHEFGEVSTQVTDGERKEIGEAAAAKPNGVMLNALGPRPSYISHGYHPHHSQFKYVRPGATTVPGGAIVGPGGVPGQVRPPFNVGSIGGSGRGEWRPIGIKTPPTLQKNFQSGFGFPAWGNNSSGSGFGRGLDFTPPSHKTVFDFDIDGFEEKPWRHPGVDTSDFFNFGLNEESWKDYCKQLGQLRLEATMQSKIRVYESGRSEQDYDPDLPPELAAATGIHDFTVENAHLSKTDGEQGDLTIQGRVNAHVRPPIPTGRAIQVEGGYGERLPSADTRPPRIRDPDAIIEIVLQDSMDDESITANSNLEGPENELQAEDQKGEYEVEEDIVKSDAGSPYNGLKKEMLGRQDPFMGSAHSNMHEGDGILPFPLQTPLHYHPVSKGHSPVNPSGSFDTTHDGRRPQGTARDKYHQVHLANAEHGNDVMPSLSARIVRVLDNEKSDGSSDVKQTSISSPSDQNESARVPATDHKSDMDNEIALTDKSVGVEGEVMGVDTMYPSDTTGDENLIHSVKKQKMSSQVEQPSMQNIDEGNNLKTKRSGETSKARSESSRDYRKRHDDGDEEVVQEKQARRMGDMRKYRDEDEHSFRKRGDCERDGRQEVDRYHNSIKGKDDSYYSHRDWDPNSAYQSHNMTRDFELSRDSNSTGVWQRRDEDAEVRRFKDEDTRKRERFEEIGSRHGSKVRESESIDRDEHLQSRTRLDNGEWRSGHDKVIGQRPRDRDDIMMSRHENLSDPHTKRRKDEEHRSREQANKEISHDFRAREGSSRRKRERDDCSDERREDQPRLRDKPDDQPLIRHRNENWRQRERDDQPRLKQPQKDTLSNREREDGRGAVRSARGMEGRPLMGSAKAKDESKSSGFDKDYQFKDKRRHNEQPKRRDRQEDNTLTQNRGHEDVYARESNTKIEERNPRHEKSRTSNHHQVNDGQWSHKERQKGSSRSKESVGADQYTTTPNKKKQDDPSVHRNLKVSTKGMSESESGNILLASGPIESGDPGPSRSSSSGKLPLKRSHPELEVPFPQQHHSSRNHREQHASFSDDEPQNSSRRGRSELESSTSHKERSRNTNNTRSLSSLSKIKEPSNRNNDRSAAASKRPDEVSKKVAVDAIIDTQHTSSHENLSEKDTINAHHDMGPPPTMPSGSNRDFESDKNGEGDRHHHHFDTVAKLKKRSERFKLPMPSEKDGTGNRMETSEAVSETGTTDAEIKHERPARKRRWISGS